MRTTRKFSSKLLFLLFFGVIITLFCTNGAYSAKAPATQLAYFVGFHNYYEGYYRPGYVYYGPRYYQYRYINRNGCRRGCLLIR